MGLHLETFDVGMTVQEMVATLQPTIAKNANTLDLKLSEDLGMMRSDVTKVRQILANLLSNACKFTDHGTISMNAERTKDQKWIRFRVRDSGIGISEKQQENLFKEFAQADVSIARKYGGTGLGLAICHRFAQLMGGNIGVESELGKGSVFTVHLPTQTVAEATSPVAPKPESVAAPVAPVTQPQADTILVIDDDAAVRDLMNRFLTKLGLNVVSASSGEEGLMLAKRIKPTIITLDVVMQGLDGWGVLSRLKSDPELANIPVIMLTIVDNEVMGLKMGASSYLVKPVDRDRLAELIEKHRGEREDADGPGVPVGAGTTTGRSGAMHTKWNSQSGRG
jgi:CheY-like chemotaxis protein